MEGSECTYKSIAGAEWARVHGLQDAVSLFLDMGYPLPRSRTPREKDNSTSANLGHSVDDFLGKSFPSLVGVTVRDMCPYRQAGVEHQHPILSPWCK